MILIRSIINGMLTLKLLLINLPSQINEAVRPRVTSQNVKKLYNKYVRVDSSNVQSIFYTSGNLMRVRFNSGSEYEYAGVPERIYMALLNAPSHGKAFWKLARNVFRYKRLPNYQ